MTSWKGERGAKLWDGLEKLLHLTRGQKMDAKGTIIAGNTKGTRVYISPSVHHGCQEDKTMDLPTYQAGCIPNFFTGAKETCGPK
uniref:Uncharacterized protein n=1 Tax=Rhizophora mucronata TaxID=61149 RepID=A0A2P2P2H6_RHIMU